MMADKSENKKKLKILFLRPGKLGDMIVATPLFKAIKSEVPNVLITLIASPYNEVVVRYNQNVDKLKVVNFHSLVALVRLVLWIRKEKIDWVIDLTPEKSTTSMIISYLVRSRKTKTAGMHKGSQSKYFDLVTEYNGIHIVERNRLLVESVLGHKFNIEFRPDIALDKQHKINAESFCNSALNIGINCSAGAPVRQWSYEKYSHLVKNIYHKYPKASIILFAVGEQTEWVIKYKKEYKEHNIISVRDKDFLTVAAIISKLDFLITPDTSLLHVASAFNIPNVGMYCIAGENFIRWRAYRTLTKEIIAQGCIDINQIQPEHVITALSELIGKNSEKNALY